MPKYKSVLDYILYASEVNSKQPLKDKFKSLNRKDKIMFILTLIILISSIIFFSLIFLGCVSDTNFILKSLIILIIILYIMIYYSEKQNIENYKDAHSSYKLRLKGLYKILKYDFKLTTKEEIQTLIQYCEDELTETTFLNRFSDFFDRIVLRIFAPFFAFIVGLLFTGTTLTKFQEQFTLDQIFHIFLNIVFFATVLLALLIGVYIIFDSVIYSMTVTRKSKIKSLQSQLIDITLTDFTD